MKNEVKITNENIDKWRSIYVCFYICPKCNQLIINQYNYCPGCGRKIIWDYEKF